jgi:hypothetical protein
MATRARRLAATTLAKLTADRLTEFADELEARATALETAPQIVGHEQAAAVQHSDPDLGQ